ncbi:AMP-binding protein [Giesbergeria giesbergeri]
MTASVVQDWNIAPQHGLSQVKGRTDAALSEATIAQFLADAVRRFPDKLAVVFREQGVRWTWTQLQEQVDALAAGFLALGLQAGDRVGIWAPNRVEWVVTQFATARIGVVLVNINPAYRVSELEYALQLAGCRALVTAEQLKSSNYLEMLQRLAPELATCAPGALKAARLPMLQAVIRLGDGHTAGMLNYGDLLAQGQAQLNVAALDAVGAGLSCHDAINIQFTSGTTGNPKGATLTHHNVVNNARFVAQAMRFTDADVLCVPVPLYHCFGMVMSVLACVSVGATMVFPGESFDPVMTLQAVSEEGCTALHGVPTMFIAELDHPRFAEFDLSHLRTGIMAGSPCPIETMKRVVAHMNLSEITIAYGMTETSPVSFQSATTDPLERRVATVGRIQPLLEAKVVNAEGQVVPVGEKGELLVRGYSVMQGYWGDADRTQEAVQDGWMHTGDLATLDEEGYCNIVGRAKDMLIRGGENVYPREIEEFLFRHPKVQSVQVFGVPDMKYGEEICAWLVPKPGHTCTEDDIRGFCRDQIAHYKVPRYIRIVQDMPMTITGKVQKFIMREQMMAELQLVQAQTA